MFKGGAESKPVDADRGGSRDRSYPSRSFMSKPNPSMQSTVFCGIDVSAATLAAAVHQEDQRFEQRVFEQQCQRPQGPDRSGCTSAKRG